MERITHSNAFVLVADDPPRKTMSLLLGSTLMTLSYQHCRRQISGAPDWTQETPPLVVTQTPRFVDELSAPFAMDAYTVLAVASMEAIARSMRPMGWVVG